MIDRGEGTLPSCGVWKLEFYNLDIDALLNSQFSERAHTKRLILIETGFMEKAL